MGENEQFIYGRKFPDLSAFLQASRCLFYFDQVAGLLIYTRPLLRCAKMRSSFPAPRPPRPSGCCWAVGGPLCLQISVVFSRRLLLFGKCQSLSCPLLPLVLRAWHLGCGAGPQREACLGRPLLLSSLALWSCPAPGPPAAMKLGVGGLPVPLGASAAGGTPADPAPGVLEHSGGGSGS